MGLFRDDIILLDFGEGAYGPTILIDTQTDKALNRLINVCSRLARPGAPAVDLARIEDVFRSSAVDSLLFRAAADDLRLQTMQGKGQGRSIVWSQLPHRWTECVRQLEALVASQLPGHQHLTEEGSDVLVVVQFKE